MKFIKCKSCNGKGRILNPHHLGFQLRAFRESRNVSLRQVSRSIGVSAPYLSDLEQGKRGSKRLLEFEQAYKLAVVELQRGLIIGRKVKNEQNPKSKRSVEPGVAR